MDKIMRVNMTDRTVRVEPLPERWRLLGGRSLTSRIVYEEVDPTCDPLGPYNKLVWAPGLLSGTVVSSSSRVSVGCKSPLTGGIKESNAGGETGLMLAQAGYRAVIVEGAAPPGTWWVLVVDAEGGRLEPCPEGITGGVGTYLAAAKLREIYGEKIGLALIGPAGEQKMGIAGICNADKEGRPSRMNARGAVGAVMGAKGLKAMVILGDKKKMVPAAEPALWKEASRYYLKGLQENPATAKFYPELGTPGVLEKVNKLGGLPTRNFSAGQFELADNISGARMRELILARGGAGQTTHSCMTGCAIRCSNVFPDAEGNEVASSMEFETNGLLGSNLGIGDLDWIARFTFLCNDLGCDTIETGGALGVCMEAGLIAWGDAAAVERILDVEVRRGTPLGKIVGAGAGWAGKVLGVRRVPVVRNQAISAYDPRVIKGNGVTYLTTPMGADHTAGNTIALNYDHLDPRGKVEASRRMQIAATILDMLGFCNFARGLFDMEHSRAFVDMFNARLGTNFEMRDLQRMALELIRMEIEFNTRAGLPVIERLPEWMRTEPLPPHNSLFDVPEEELEKIWAVEI